MGVALKKCSRVFGLHIRCENCLKESVKEVVVEEGNGTPTDADDLLESGIIGNLPFHCGRCESVIGRLFGITVREVR